MPRKVRFDETALNKLLKRQELVISRSQALAGGMTAGVLRRRAEPGGPWQRLLPGVYLTVTGSPTRDEREIAALRYAGETSVITGLAARRPPGARLCRVYIHDPISALTDSACVRFGYQVASAAWM